MPPQVPLAHWPFIMHGWPLASRQAPMPLQVCVGSLMPPQIGLKSAELSGTFVQTPRDPDTLHAMHVAEQVLLQQTPSVQESPGIHSPEKLQTFPCESRHVPIPLHWLGALQIPAG